MRHRENLSSYCTIRIDRTPGNMEYIIPMDEMNTAMQIDATEYVAVEQLNRLSNAHVFIATAPAVILCPGVTLGPVRVFDRPDEIQWLVRWDGAADVLKPAASECLTAIAKRVQRRLNRIEGNAHRARLEAQRREEQAAAKAACPGHEYVGREVGRSLTYYGCKNCGCGETVDSSG